MKKETKGPFVEEGGRATLSGSVEAVIFRSESSDYTVIELLSEGGERLVAVGNMPYLAEGEEAVLYGHYTTHAEYGKQFSVETYEKRLPTGAAAILKYLSSRTVRGVGAATAIKIVERYGDDTFEVIENHPEWLADIPGISPKKAKEIHQSFCEQSGIRNLMMFCRDYFGSTVINRIYKQWGSGAVGIIKENPYRLCRDIFGIGFERADAIAASLGIERESQERLVSGLSYILQQSALSSGHTCMPRDKLLAAAEAQLSVDASLIAAALLAAEESRILFKKEVGGVVYWYLKKYYDAEEYVARRLLDIDKGCPAFHHNDIDRLIEKAEIESGITYATAQRRSLREAMRCGVLVLTGGPGTGKTTIIKGLLSIFGSIGMRVALAAPTGRAAKRMSEATSSEAKTVHRLLESIRSEGDMPHFSRNQKNPLEEDVLIVDELSMLDILLSEALLRAVKRGARLIFVGDSDQLPSVGAGNVLGDLIESGCLNTVRLEEIFRQSRESLIVLNAHKINEGEMPTLTVSDNDFFFLSRREEEIPQTVADLLARRLPKAYGKSAVEQTQVITPSRRGSSGTEALNALLQAVLNKKDPKKKELFLGERTYRVGDRVMQTRNNYGIEWVENPTDNDGVFNGDIGVITDISEGGAFMDVLFDGGRIARYDKGSFDELELAYAITVHKSQGSEYGTVILPLYNCPPMLKTRNLLYTAVTRARTRVILVGREDILQTMVENDRQLLRYTLLCHNLRSGQN